VTDPTANLRPWLRVLKDILLVILGTFMLMHETLATIAPSPVVVGAALVTLGLPKGLNVKKSHKSRTEQEVST
jgi:uncharacterized membrane protein HdeD (DUF308 family)